MNHTLHRKTINIKKTLLKLFGLSGYPNVHAGTFLEDNPLTIEQPDTADPSSLAQRAT